MSRLLSNLDRLKELRKKNARLREALKEIAEGAGDYYQDEQAQIAIQALEETK